MTAGGGPALPRPGPAALLQRPRHAVEAVARLMNDAAGWLFVVCALFVSFDVLARKFFSFSSRATVELTGYMLAFGIAWGLADALTNRAHIRVDVIVSRLPLRVRAWMHALALAFLVTLGFLFTWRGWSVVRESWEFGARDSSALTIPLMVPQGLWAVGLSVFFAVAVLRLGEVLALLALRRWPDVEALLGPRTLVEEADDAIEAAGLARPGAVSAP